jgi:hypothetical protein
LSCQRWLCRSIFVEIILRSGKWISCVAFFIAVWEGRCSSVHCFAYKQSSAPDWNWLDQDRLHYHFVHMCGRNGSFLNLAMIQNGRGHW